MIGLQCGLQHSSQVLPSWSSTALATLSSKTWHWLLSFLYCTYIHHFFSNCISWPSPMFCIPKCHWLCIPRALWVTLSWTSHFTNAEPEGEKDLTNSQHEWLSCDWVSRSCHQSMVLFTLLPGLLLLIISLRQPCFSSLSPQGSPC